MSGTNLVNALRLVLAGGVFVPQEVLLETAHQKPAGTDAPVGVLAKLSPREHDILAGVIAGGTNKEIARDRDLEEITVKVHLRNVYKKLGASNRADAVRIALQNGWTD